jgi:hypothetical protein
MKEIHAPRSEGLTPGRRRTLSVRKRVEFGLKARVHHPWPFTLEYDGGPMPASLRRPGVITEKHRQVVLARLDVSS